VPAKPDSPPRTRSVPPAFTSPSSRRGSSPAARGEHFYDSLTLFSPAKYCALPGLPFAGDQRRYPHRDEAAAHLRQYAEHFQLPIRTGSRVAAVRSPRGGFTLDSTAARR
jgi:cation diffusion facilitator CzcD-associated flavoprotein CzcO